MALSNKSMQDFVERQFAEESAELLRKINETAMLGQKRTSAHKALVYLLPEQHTVVYKGPYLWPQKAPMLAQMLFRCDLFQKVWKNGCATTGPIQIIRFPNRQLFLRMPHVSEQTEVQTAPAAAWNGKSEEILGEERQRVVASKESQGILELSVYLAKPRAFQQDSVLLDALIHFIHRFICDPIVGDAALRNVLICIDQPLHRAVGIDFEENRTGGEEKRRSEESGGLFAMICGGKLWNREALRLLEAALRRDSVRVLTHLTNDVDANWLLVEQLVVQHRIPAEIVSVARMRARCSAIIAAVKAISVAKTDAQKRKSDSVVSSEAEALKKKKNH